jgi:hypothetical protein
LPVSAEQCNERRSTLPKREPPETQAGGSIEDTILRTLESLRDQMKKARLFLAAAEAACAQLEAIRAGHGAEPHPRAIADLPYVGMDVIEAILLLLNERDRALPRQEIIDTVLARGVFVGKGIDAKGEPAVQVGKSLKYHLLSKDQRQKTYGKRKIKAVDPVLREMNGLIGRSEWLDEKFVAA